MAEQVQINNDGSITSNRSMSTKNHTSSDDYQNTGIQAREGMSTRHVSDHTRLNDNEIIRVDGMEITVSMARDLGLLGGHVQDEGLSAASAARRIPEAPTVAPQDTQETTGHQGYDATVAELNSQVEAGQLSEAEAGEYSTALGQVALAGLTVTEVSDVIDGMRNGSVDQSALTHDQRVIVNNLESTVQTASTQSAMSELGEAGFQRISEIAKADAEFNEVLRGYASMRALGKADHTWPEFLAEAEAWTRGQR